MSAASFPSTSSDESSSSSLPSFYHTIVEGEVIEMSKKVTLQVEEMIGEGTFGRMFSVRQASNSREFAMKVLPRRTAREQSCADSEAQVLMRIHTESAYKDHLLRVSAIFERYDNLCILMEKMDIDLWHFIRERNHRPLPVAHVKTIAKQILSAVARLHSMGLMHTDVKPENIMFANREKNPYMIKLIDYGSTSSILAAKDNVGQSIQTMFYRSPEIMFGLPFNEKVDVWSVGCVLAELYLGCALYPGLTEYQMIRFIATTQGLPPNLGTSKHWTKFLCSVEKTVVDGSRSHTRTTYRMKSSEECRLSGVDVGATDNRWYKLQGLNTITKYGYSTLLEGVDCAEEDCLFASLLSSLLTLSVHRRPSADTLKQHPFLVQTDRLAEPEPVITSSGAIRREKLGRKDSVLSRKPLAVIRQ